ncbi:MAG: hydrolase [Flavobacteriaceae bacterium]|nr:MAG: hydrolase [Flavobacteriaceae bacterium]
MKIAVDFDGTIVSDSYPKIGKTRLFAFDVLLRLQAEGHQLLLWTVRDGIQLEEAVAFCKKNGLVFYAVNKNFPEEESLTTASRKLNADIFIDDKNIGGILPWGEVYQQLGNEKTSLLKQKKSWWF